tara:strand:- start:283 stop:495 length:213 start_codon:yes stop_codon:yes gene_type:complete
MKKYKVYYERRYDKELDDFFTNSQSIEVEAENESQAYEVAEEKIYSNSHTENFDDLNLLNCEEVKEEKND